MADNDANLVSDSADEAEGLYDRIDELLAEIDEACEITSDGFDPDEVDAELPAIGDKGELTEIPDLELESPDLDLDGDFEGESPDDLLGEIEEPADDQPEAVDEAEPAIDAADEPGLDPRPAAEPSEDDDLLAAINEQLANLDDPDEPAEDEPQADEPAAEAAETEPEHATSLMNRTEPPEEVNPEEVSVEFDLEDLDDMVAELDEQKGSAKSPQASETPEPVSKPEPKAEPEPTPDPRPESEPVSASEPETAPNPVNNPAGKPAPRAKPNAKPKRDLAPVLAVAYRAGAVALSPIAKVLDSQPRMLRDSIGWVGAITVFYAVCLWTYALLFRGTSAPEQPAQGVTIVGETQPGE